MVSAAPRSYDGGNPDRVSPADWTHHPVESAELVLHEQLKEVAVPLSEHEQRMLDEIESALYADDPKFASSVKKTGSSGVARPTGLVVVLGIVGLALLVGGLALDFKPGGFPVLSLVGFLTMFAAGVLALRSSATGGASRPGKDADGGGGRGGRAKGSGRPGSGSGNGGQSYSSRMEDRFRKRFEQ